jgi:hypothetical protein
MNTDSCHPFLDDESHMHFSLLLAGERFELSTNRFHSSHISQSAEMQSFQPIADQQQLHHHDVVAGLAKTAKKKKLGFPRTLRES